MLNSLHQGCRWTARRKGQSGLSIVELLVGVALGLFLVAGAVTMFVGNMGNSRQLLLEARVNQDLRAAADLVTRDLRRAGYWGNAVLATTAVGAMANPYAAITPGTGIVEYRFSRDVTEDNALGSNEQFGFQRAIQGGVGVIQMKLGVVSGSANWQAVTDPQTIDISAFDITPTETPVDMRGACARWCCTTADVTAGAPGCCTAANVAAGVAGCIATANLSAGVCPTVRVRDYQIVLTGNAAGNTNVARTLTTRVRARNDQYAGACPA